MPRSRRSAVAGVGLPAALPAPAPRAKARAEPAVPDLRARILGAAERLFVDRGYAAPSLRDLIAAAGCSTTAFYARFPTKEAVLRELVDQLLEDLLAAAATALAEASSVPHGFALGLDALVGVIGERKGLVRVALTAEEPAVRRALHARYQALAQLLSAQLTHVGHPDGPARGWALVGALELAVRRWAVFGEVADDALAEVLADTARTLLPT